MTSCLLVLCFQEDVLSITDMTSLHTPLDIPIPEPPNPEEEEVGCLGGGG